MARWTVKECFKTVPLPTNALVSYYIFFCENRFAQAYQKYQVKKSSRVREVLPLCENAKIKLDEVPPPFE